MGEEQEMEQLFYTPSEVSKMMQIRPETVYEMLYSGELPAMKVGTRFKILKEDFNTWIRSRIDTETKERKKHG